MDQKTQDLVRQLCTRIGMIMEDEVTTAQVWESASQITLEERPHRLERAGRSISALAEAANAIVA